MYSSSNRSASCFLSSQLADLSVNASLSRDIRTRGMLEGVVATRRTNGQTGVFLSMFVCPSDTRSQSSYELGTLWGQVVARMEVRWILEWEGPN